MFFELNHFGLNIFFSEFKKLFSLAWPMYIAMILLVGMGIVDTIVAGHYGTSDLAAVSLSSQIFFTLFVALSGLIVALNPMFSQMFGAKKTKEIGELFRQGLMYSVLISILGMVILFLAVNPLIHYLQKQNYDLYTQNVAKIYLFIMILAIPASLLEKMLQIFSSSLNKTKLVMATSIVGFLINIPLDIIFVNGFWRFSELGGIGCAVATCCIFWIMFFVLSIFIIKDKYFKPFTLFDKWQLPDLKIFKDITRLGIPISISYFLEMSVFLAITIAIVHFGAYYIAAQQLVSNITGFLYMLPQTIGAATSVRVGQTIGTNSLIRSRYISGIGLCLGILGSIFTALFLILFRHEIPYIYSHDIEVINIVSPILIVGALFQVSDAIQITAAGALRGYSITKIPMYINAFSYWVVGFGFGWYFGVYLGYALKGFWMGMALGLTICAVLMVSYLEIISKQLMLGSYQQH